VLFLLDFVGLVPIFSLSFWLLIFFVSHPGRFSPLTRGREQSYFGKGKDKDFVAFFVDPCVGIVGTSPSETSAENMWGVCVR